MLIQNLRTCTLPACLASCFTLVPGLSAAESPSPKLSLGTPHRITIKTQTGEQPVKATGGAAIFECPPPLEKHQCLIWQDQSRNKIFYAHSPLPFQQSDGWSLSAEIELDDAVQPPGINATLVGDVAAIVTRKHDSTVQYRVMRCSSGDGTGPVCNTSQASNFNFNPFVGTISSTTTPDIASAGNKLYLSTSWDQGSTFVFLGRIEKQGTIGLENVALAHSPGPTRLLYSAPQKKLVLSCPALNGKLQVIPFTYSLQVPASQHSLDFPPLTGPVQNAGISQGLIKFPLRDTDLMGVIVQPSINTDAKITIFPDLSSKTYTWPFPQNLPFKGSKIIQIPFVENESTESPTSFIGEIQNNGEIWVYPLKISMPKQ